MQISGESGTAQKSAIEAITKVFKEEGIVRMYQGLSAGLFRQATYTTTRLGAFQYLNERFQSQKSKWKAFVIGAASGGIGAIVGTPAEVSLVRMTADGSKPEHLRRNYKNVFHSLAVIIKEEGVLTLWRGVTPTVMRAMVLNTAQLGGYAQLKTSLIGTGYFKDNVYLHFVASMGAGLLSTAVSIPVDILKTRLQNMQPGQYSGVVDCFTKIVRKEGVLSLWRGFTPYYFRLGPHTVFTFIFLEQINKQTNVMLKRNKIVN
jgi:solute carrier family 25 oxoglutarate transporter 11